MAPPGPHCILSRRPQRRKGTGSQESQRDYRDPICGPFLGHVTRAAVRVTRGHGVRVQRAGGILCIACLTKWEDLERDVKVSVFPGSPGPGACGGRQSCTLFAFGAVEHMERVPQVARRACLASRTFARCHDPRALPHTCNRREEGAGGSGTQNCVPKIAQINISFCKFHFVPR